MSQPLYIKIKDQDNVAIAVKDIKAGTEVMDGVIAHQDIPQAHKIALCDIEKGREIIRYGGGPWIRRGRDKKGGLD